MKRAIAILTGVLLIGCVVAAGGTAVADNGGDVVTVTTTVTDSNGEPVGNVDLTATWDGGSTTTSTASNGKAFLDVPEGETIVVELDHDTYVQNEPYEFVAEADGEESIDVVEGGSISVDTTAGDDELGEVRVIVRQNGEIVSTGHTDDDGAYETGRIEQGEYTVAVVKRGFFRERTTVDVDGDVSESFALERGSVTVRFNVTDDHYDRPEPVKEAKVSVEGSGSVTTLSNGEATVSVPVNADVTVVVSKQGHEEKETEVSIEESDTTVDVTISRIPEITLEPDNERVVSGVELGVSVTDEYGDPVEEATVRLDGEVVGETNEDGEIRVPIEEEGEFELSASAGDLDAQPVTIEAISDAEDLETESTDGDSQLPDEVPDAIKEEVPGFGPGAALVALLSLAFVAVKRQ